MFEHTEKNNTGWWAGQDRKKMENTVWKTYKVTFSGRIELHRNDGSKISTGTCVKLKKQSQWKHWNYAQPQTSCSATIEMEIVYFKGFFKNKFDLLEWRYSAWKSKT